MAIECPVVSTAIGAEGIPCQAGEHLWLADSPADFAAAVLRLLDDQPLRARLARQAGEWVRQRYGWGLLGESAKARLHDCLCSVREVGPHADAPAGQNIR